MKTCPYCAETDLKDAAVTCKHCGRDMPMPEKERRVAVAALVLALGVIVVGASALIAQLSNPDAHIVVEGAAATAPGSPGK